MLCHGFESTSPADDRARSHMHAVCCKVPGGSAACEGKLGEKGDEEEGKMCTMQEAGYQVGFAVVEARRLFDRCSFEHFYCVNASAIA